MLRLKRQIDGKYWVNEAGEIYNSVSGEVIPQDEPLFLLRGRDVVAADTIENYTDFCREESCHPSHVGDASNRAQEFKEFARDHGDRMKTPGPPLEKI